MKTLILGLAVLLFSVQVSAQDAEPDQTHCRKAKNKQVVTIIADPANAGEYLIKNKKGFRYCNIDNSGGNGVMVWKFHKDISACQRNSTSCTVTLNDASPADQRKIKCAGNNNDGHFKCRLNVNQLKDHCDKVDGEAPTDSMCLIDYTVRIEGKEIDPTILITPRPSSN